jgi:hypothetical protein
MGGRLDDAQVNDAVADFNAALPDVPLGCETCGGSIKAVCDYVLRANRKVPVMVLDIVHSDASCHVLTKFKVRGSFPLGGNDTQWFCQHRLDDSDSIWRCELPSTAESIDHMKPEGQKLRIKLLRLYFDQGIAGVREQIDVLCPGCVTDLIVAYVVSDSERALEAEFTMG